MFSPEVLFYLTEKDMNFYKFSGFEHFLTAFLRFIHKFLTDIF